MKRLLQLILCMIVCVLLAGTICADSISVPEDDFFKTHKNEFTDNNGDFVVNTREGGARVYAEPMSSEVIATLENGAIRTEVVYLDSWISTICQEGDGWKRGWVRISDGFFPYSMREFDRDYKEEYFKDDELWSEYLAHVEEGTQWMLYEYPGSGLVWDYTDARYEVPDSDGDYRTFLVEPDSSYRAFYRDIHEDLWVKVSGGWVFLPDPTNTELQGFMNPDPGRYPAKPIEAYPDGNPKTKRMILAGVLVAAVAAVSGVLIHSLGKKKRA